MKLTIGVTTAPRGVNYLDDLLDHIPSWASVVIAPSGCRCRISRAYSSQHTVLAPNCDIPGRAVPLEQNHDRLIETLAGEDDVFLTLQDDARACLNAYERVAQVADWMRRTPRVAFVSFYTPYAQCGRNRSALWPYTTGFYGEVAILWNRTAALEFTARPHKGRTEHDLAIQHHFRGRNWLIAGHSPCLFQHVGVDSSIGNSWEVGQRQTMNWKADHDAVAHAKALNLVAG